MNAAVPVLGKGHVARNFIGGEWRLPRHGYEIDVYAPTSIEELGSVPRSAAADADDALDRAGAALRHDIGAIVWRRAGEFCETVRARAAEIARVEHLDSGAPIEFATRTVHDSASWMEGRLERDHAGANVAACGCNAWILPAYAPFWLYCSQVFEALLAGHAVILKPSSTTPMTAVCFAEMIADLDLPAGCFALLQGTGRDVGTALARSPKIDRLGFVGGRDAARMVTRSAAEPLTACVISTGNLNPSVLLADGDLESLAGNLVASLFAHAGQGGFASRWCLTPEERMPDVLAALERGLDALDASGGAGTSVAPLVSEDRRVRVVRFLTALERYAPESTIGTVQRSKAFPMGYFVSPSVVVDASPNDLVRGVDLPGPVLFLSSYRSEEALASALLDMHGSGALSVYSARGAEALPPVLARTSYRLRVNGRRADDADAAESLWCGFHER